MLYKSTTVDLYFGEIGHKINGLYLIINANIIGVRVGGADEQ